MNDNDFTNPTNTNNDVAEISDEELRTVLEGMSNDEVMRTLAVGMLIEKNLGEMDDETRGKMVNDLVERMGNFVNQAIVNALPEGKLDELDDLIEQDAATPEAVDKLIQESGIDTEAVISGALEKFREIYLGESGE